MDIPVGTVSEEGTERRERDRGGRRRGARDGAVRNAQQAHRRATLQRRVEVLEAKLDEKDRQLQAVIDRYERLLAEARAEGGTTSDDRSAAVDDGLRATLRDALDR